MTAVDTAGELSRTRGDLAHRATSPDRSSPGPALTADPSAERCVSAADADGDRLPDAVETDTGIYVGPSTGTDPTVADTDGDGISDGDEVLGTTAGLHLPALGTSRSRRTCSSSSTGSTTALELRRPTPTGPRPGRSPA